MHKVFTLVALRQFLNASTRLWAIMMSSRPLHGWPILRAFLDMLERIAADSHPDTVAPSLAKLLKSIEDRCPGVMDAVLRPRGVDHHGHRDRVEGPPEEEG